MSRPKRDHKLSYIKLIASAFKQHSYTAFYATTFYDLKWNITWCYIHLADIVSSWPSINWLGWIESGVRISRFKYLTLTSWSFRRRYSALTFVPKGTIIFFRSGGNLFVRYLPLFSPSGTCTTGVYFYRKSKWRPYKSRVTMERRWYWVMSG